MAKGDKEQMWRREGMLYARKLVKEGGIEKLDKELRWRGIFKIDIAMSEEQVERVHDFLSQNLYQTLLSTAVYSLREYAGWGKKKLHEWVAEFDRNAGNLLDLNWHGEHYVRFQDMAGEMNEKFGFNFDMERIRMLDDSEAETNPVFRKMDLEETCDFLKREGFTEAAERLQKHVEWLRS